MKAERMVTKSSYGSRCSIGEISPTLANQRGRPNQNQLTLPTTTTSSSKANRSGVEKLKEDPETSNPYVKPLGPKCFRCGIPGHRPNVCPKRGTFYAEHEDEEGLYLYEPSHELESLGLEYIEAVEGEAKQVAYVIQRTLCLPKVSGSSQRNRIFQSKYLIKEKEFSIIIHA